MREESQRGRWWKPAIIVAGTVFTLGGSEIVASADGGSGFNYIQSFAERIGGAGERASGTPSQAAGPPRTSGSPIAYASAPVFLPARKLIYTAKLDLGAGLRGGGAQAARYRVAARSVSDADTSAGGVVKDGGGVIVSPLTLGGGGNLPYNTYLAADLSDAISVIGNHDSVDMYSGAYYSQPYGSVTFTDGVSLAAGSKLWIVAGAFDWPNLVFTNGDHQVVGEVDLHNNGAYRFSLWGATNGIYGNDIITETDEGAEYREGLLVIAQTTNDVFYLGYFSSGTLTNGYIPTTTRNNITITYTVIPEPSALPLVLVGGSALLLARRKRGLV